MSGAVWASADGREQIRLSPELLGDVQAAFAKAAASRRLVVAPPPASIEPFQPSGLRDETECPTEHYDADVIRNGCYTCGAAV